MKSSDDEFLVEPLLTYAHLTYAHLIYAPHLTCHHVSDTLATEVTALQQYGSSWSRKLAIQYTQ